MLIHQLLYQGIKENIAFFDKRPITYKKLQNMVNLYRDFFYNHGVRSGDNVGLLSKNSVEFVYSYFAIVSLGAVVVPINFQLVAREVAFIVQNAKIKVLVSMTYFKIEPELNNYGYDQEVLQLIIPDFADTLETKNLPKASVSESFSPDTVCTIIYTSGTTGKPKGAMLTHKNLISDTQAFCKAFPIDSKDHTLCVLPMYHCFAWTCAVLVPLFKGSTITVLESFSVKEAIATIRDAGITIVFAVPPMYNLFASWGCKQDFDKVKLFTSGGSSLPKEIIQKFYNKTGKVILEGYGLSEASPVVALNPYNKIKYGSIGKALPGIDVKIVNNKGQILKVGEIGELLVRGPNIMQGYFEAPEETAKALYGGWLHTGDLAYQDEEGYIYIVDRLKDMIITSGENIYPREIEELLYAYPAVTEAAVVGIPDKLRGDSVCAYVVAEEGHILDKKSLRNYLKERLAPYKVPREFAQVAALPKNSTGKILKRVLREHAPQKII